MKGLNSYTINYKKVKGVQKVKDFRPEDNKIKRVLTKIITAVVGIIILSILLTSLFSIIGFGENSSNFVKHEIDKGESLWLIAAQYYDSDNIDLRRIIYKIKKLNNIDSSVISPGREILIPIQYE